MPYQEEEKQAYGCSDCTKILDDVKVIHSKIDSLENLVTSKLKEIDEERNSETTLKRNSVTDIEDESLQGLFSHEESPNRHSSDVDVNEDNRSSVSLRPIPRRKKIVMDSYFELSMKYCEKKKAKSAFDISNRAICADVEDLSHETDEDYYDMDVDEWQYATSDSVMNKPVFSSLKSSYDTEEKETKSYSIESPRSSVVSVMKGQAQALYCHEYERSRGSRRKIKARKELFKRRSKRRKKAPEHPAKSLSHASSSFVESDISDSEDETRVSKKGSFMCKHTGSDKDFVENSSTNQTKNHKIPGKHQFQRKNSKTMEKLKGIRVRIKDLSTVRRKPNKKISKMA